MESQYVITNISEALTTRLFPTVTVWNRLEGRPRTVNFDRALKAEVRDALWMLTRQWQMGEFRGDDAGSPVFAKIHMATTRLNKYKPNGHATEAFDDDTPLEAEVERRPIPFTLGGQKIALDLRLQMGRQWLKLVKPVGDYAGEFKKKYPIQMPDPNRKEDAQICAHPEVWQNVAAVARRMMDGANLYVYLKGDPARHAYDGVVVDDGDKSEIDDQAAKFIEWFEALYFQPSASGEDTLDAWEPSHLEYQFACSAPEAAGEKVLVADEYYHGHLDWYNLDFDKASRGLGEVTDGGEDPRGASTRTLIPAPVVFDGMPNTRWWAFEDRRTNFGDVKPDTTDLAKLLLIEFALVYANDWFIVPYDLPLGAVARIRGMAVTNVFGERFWIEAAGSGADDDWQRWSMFTLNIKGKAGEAADTSLLLLPTLLSIQEGRPLEEAMLIRDEVANMVWGIERTIPLPDGGSKPGGEAAIETLNFFKRLLKAQPATEPDETLIDNDAKIRYEVMNTVPENWIPFIPVHIAGDNREIQLRRAAMPRILEGDPDKPVRVEPRTILLREGRDRNPREPYFVNEEEVPRAGARVTQSFQRTRWRDGRVFVWLGVRKQTGRGEGSSGLAFDRIVDVPPSN